MIYVHIVKALKESCENCVAACAAACKTDKVRFTFIGSRREPCGKVFLERRSNLFGGSFARSRVGLRPGTGNAAVDQFKSSAQLPVAYSDPH